MSRLLLAIAGVIGIALLVAWTLTARTPQMITPEGSLGTTTPTMEENADSKLGQFTERQNSPPTASVQAPAAPVALVPGCALYFSFVPDTKLVSPGGAITYTFTISNQGTAPCQNTSFSAYWDSEETFVSASPASTASTYYWSIGTLASRVQRVITATTRANAAAAQLSNEACATADNSDDVCAQNTIFAGASAPIAAVSPAPSISSLAPATPDKKEMGLWVWDTPAQMPAGYAARMMSTAAQNGFNTLYITVDDYLDIAALPDGADKNAKKQKYFATLASIVSAANQKAIAIYIEGGARDWAYPENRWKGYALIDFLSEYNKAYPLAQVHGLQYDVEPYLLPEYQDNKAEVLTQFLEFIDESTTRMQKVEGTFSVVIPHFYDSKQAWTPAVTYNDSTAYTFTQLLKILERKPGSSLIIMAYRNFFEGDGGTKEISQAEIDEATAGGYKTNIIVAQETGNVDPSYVTFYGLSKADLLAGIKDVYAAFGSSKNFGGVAIHYLEPFLDLK